MSTRGIRLPWDFRWLNFRKRKKKKSNRTEKKSKAKKTPIQPQGCQSCGDGPRLAHHRGPPPLEEVKPTQTGRATKTDETKTTVEAAIVQLPNTAMSQKLIDSLVGQQTWDLDSKLNRTLTYGFWKPTDPTTDLKDASYALGLHSDAMKRAWRAAIRATQASCRIRFEEVEDATSADLKLILVTDPNFPYLGSAHFPPIGQIMISYAHATDKTFTLGGWDHLTLQHELLHALGVPHSHDTGNGSTAFVSTWSDLGVDGINSCTNTVMSYNDLRDPRTPANPASYGFIGSPMAYDLAALKVMYGQRTIATGEGEADVYPLPSENKAGTFFEALSDAKGSADKVVAPVETASGVEVDLRPGGVNHVRGIHGGLSIAPDTVVEAASGSNQADRLVGNDASNVLDGKAGDDVIQGEAGDDVIQGEAGEDVLDGDAGDDTLKGGEGNDTLDGGSGDDRVEGGDGDDLIKGGAGVDKLIGGKGDDVFHVGPGRNIVYGQSGINTLIFPTTRDETWVSLYNGSHWRFAGKTDQAKLAIGVTSAKGIQFVQFAGDEVPRSTETFVPDLTLTFRDGGWVVG